MVEMHGTEPLKLTAQDVELIRQSRSRARYSEFSDQERAAYQRTHAALGQLGQLAVSELNGTRDYALKLTSGFHPVSGIRGGKPKDLWFGIYRKENESHFLGNPQIFMIVSGRGIEYGFSPLTHPDDFSNQDIKRRTRHVARSILGQMPAPDSADARELADQLAKSGRWHFRRKQRLDPNQSEYQSLKDWLTFVRSEDGIQNAGGGITRYVSAEQINEIDLVDEVRQMTRIFRPLMERIVADDPPSNALRLDARHAPIEPVPTVPALSFGDLLVAFLNGLANARRGPFQKINALWNSIASLKARLEEFPAVQKRPDLVVSISVGQGNWATVPWIALLNTNVTNSTQEGIYVVFLVAK